MEEEIRSWPVSVFDVSTTQVTVNASNDVMIYEIFADDGDPLASAALFIRKLDLRRSNPSGTSLHHGRPRRARILRQMPVATYTSGLCIQITEKIANVTQYDLVYAKKFDLSTFTSATELQTTVGLDDSMLDIVEYGVMARLLVGKEGRRVERNRQGQPKDAQQVREGAAFQTGAAYGQMAQTRLNAEAQRLLHDWPIQTR